ncbi:MAG: sensor histidine kinase [Chloroflexi bacterium]|nr:sensor histidine kinase [Chloroflexota bacterium]
MSQPTQLKPSQPSTIKIETSKSTTRFTNNTVNVVVLVLLIVAYIPALLDTNFYQPLNRFVIVIILGVLYGFVGTVGMMWHEAQGTKLAAAVFFSAQISILFSLIILSDGIDHNFWLLMLPISAQGLALGWQGALGISLIQLAGFWIIHYPIGSFNNLINNSLSIGSAMLFTVLFTLIAIREVSAREEIERLATDLREANHRLAEYASQVEELATMRERNRLAREIHDNLGHYLTVVNVQIEAARTVMDKQPDKAKDALHKAQGLTQDGLKSVRQSVSALRESPLAERPLPEAIIHLLQQTEETGITTTFSVKGKVQAIDPKLALTLYRSVQEALTNARKHAQATQISITLSYETSQHIKLIVQDNGVGTDNIDGGFGLLGLRERVHLLNGQFETSSTPGQGFSINVIIPIQ